MLTRVLRLASSSSDWIIGKDENDRQSSRRQGACTSIGALKRPPSRLLSPFVCVPALIGRG